MTGEITIFDANNQSKYLPLQLEQRATPLRFVRVLAYLEKLRPQLDSVQRDNKLSASIAREAIEYQPPLVKQIVISLFEAHVLLMQATGQMGHYNNPANLKRHLKRLTEQFVTSDRVGQVARQSAATTKTNNSFVRDIAKATHPDSNSKETLDKEVIGDENASEFYSKVMNASRSGDAQDLRELRLELLPKYIDFVRGKLAEGLSLKQIVQAYPELVGQLEQLAYIGHYQLSVWKNNITPEKAKVKAAKTIAEKNIYSRAIAFGMMHELVEGLIDYYQGINFGDAQRMRLHIGQHMQEIAVHIIAASKHEKEKGVHANRGISERFGQAMEDKILTLPSDIVALARLVIGGESRLGDIKKALGVLGFDLSQLREAAVRYYEEVSYDPFANLGSNIMTKKPIIETNFILNNKVENFSIR